MSESRDPESLPWIQHPFAALVRLAWPIAVSMLSYSAMTIADTLFVSRIGPAALAGVGLGGVAGFTLLCFPLGLLQGVKVLVSQAVGAQRHDEVGGHLRAGLVMAAALGAGVAGLAHALVPLLGALAASVEAGALAGEYLSVRLISAPVFLAFVALRETVYGTGDARTPMIASVVGNLANIALDYLFVVGLDQGVAGVAWASVIANCVEAGLLFWVRAPLVRGALARASGPRGHLAWTRGLRAQVRALWRVGLPTGGQFLLEVGAFSLLTALISAMSEIEMAAHQIVLHLFHVAFLPSHAVAEASSVLAGQAVGARRDDLVGSVARRGLMLACGYALLCSLLSTLGGRLVLRAFTEDPALTRAALGILQVAAMFLVVDAANMVVRAVLRGTGDVRYAAVIGIGCAWLLLPPCTWLFGYGFDMGARGGWVAMFAEIVTATSLLSWRFLRGGWRAAAARSRADAGAAPAGAGTGTAGAAEARAAPAGQPRAA